MAGLSAVRHDVPPYMLVEGYPARPRCINAVALKRNNFPAARDPGPGRGPPAALPRQGRPGQRLGNPPQQRPVGAAGQPPLGFVQGQHEGQHGRGREQAARRGSADRRTGSVNREEAEAWPSIGGRTPGRLPRPEVPACTHVELVAVVDPVAATASAWPPSATPGRWPTIVAAGPGRRRGDRRAHPPAPRVGWPFSTRASTC